MVPTQAPSQDQLAEQLISRFVRRFDSSYEWLLYYAALPLVLTPELLNYLRNQFLRDRHLPWVSEVDLLLSDLCSPVGDEQYAMDSHVRDYLIRKALEMLGQSELERVAKLLIRYVDHLSRSNQYLTIQERRSQQWAAMVFIDSERGRVAKDIAEAFQSSETPEIGQARSLSLVNRAEMLRLSLITQKLAPQLLQHQALVKYAQSVTQALHHPESLEPDQWQQQFHVNDIILTIPSSLNQNRKDEDDWNEAIIPVLESFGFTEAHLTDSSWPPSLQTEDFTVCTFQLEPEAPENLQPFEFKVVTLHKLNDRWDIQRQPHRAYQYLEPLPGNLPLEMVSIPAGTFMMGSPADEPEHYDDESPQHEVKVESFFMGRYPIAQAQWRTVAAMPQVTRELDPDPSNFKGDNRPVEKVSWYDAVEFCERLSKYTGRIYRLPTEAEWEYACRAGTSTPFNFGAMITSELSNFAGETAYNNGPKGESRGETTPVDQFESGNVFGLSDMHGNVFEWCQDHWHSNYDGAPDDGSAWLTEKDVSDRVRRGGSWYHFSWYCRSAYRSFNIPDSRYYFIGFRVVCSAPRALS
jgi:formylglycine-generating enzyme required for sulfatase activity